MKNQNEDRPDKDFFTGEKKPSYDPVSLIAFICGVVVILLFLSLLFKHLLYK